MGNPADLLEPGQAGQINLSAPVTKTEVSEDVCPRGIFGADLRFAANDPAVPLEQVSCRSNVWGNHAVADSNAVDLYRQQDRDVQLVHLTGELHNRRSAEALTVDDQSDRRPLEAVDMSVAVSVERIPDECYGKVPLLVFDGFDVHPVDTGVAEPDRQPPHTDLGVVPGIASPEKADDEKFIGRDRSRGREVLVTLSADEETAGR